MDRSHQNPTSVMGIQQASWVEVAPQGGKLRGQLPCGFNLNEQKRPARRFLRGGW
jgi:hypothetical protein